MIKNVLCGIFLMLLTLPTYSQSIVNTDPQNKKVILEEYTGINCVYCPEGHVIAQNIKNANPDNFFIINVHQGGFSTPSGTQPDFRTPYGNALAAQFSISSYPIGTVSRSGSALGRGQWAAATNTLLSQPSYVNVAAEASINVATRLLTIEVEAYYTGNSPKPTNKLNVALLQNNTLGPQTGGNMGNNYNHMHRLVELVTGQWGEEITTTTSGSLVTKTYTYTIPAAYNGVEAKLKDMEIIVFMAEDNKEIISGNGIYPTYTGFANANDALIASVSEIKPNCSGVVSPVIVVENNGGDNITSLSINYSVNGGTVKTHTWTGEISSFETATVTLDEIEFNVQETNTLTVTLANDDDNTNNSAEKTFEEAMETVSTLKLRIDTDNFGGQLSWDIKNSAGEVVESGSGYGNNVIENILIHLEGGADCFQFNIYDSAGNGGHPITLRDANNKLIYYSPGTYGAGDYANFNANGTLGVTNFDLSSIVLYPNPTSGFFTLNSGISVDMEIFDMTGKLVYTKNRVEDNAQVDISNLTNGLYIVKMHTEQGSSVQKLVKK